MICASCDREIPDNGLICLDCNVPDPKAAAAAAQPTHRELARTARRLKGLVCLSVFFGIFLAPFVIWISTDALMRSADVSTADPAVRRQLVVLRRVAIGLLLVWAVLLGRWARWYIPFGNTG